MKSSGSVLGGALLIAGSCIGAGMLALPILTGLAGFFPALALLLLAWGYMTYTGLLLVDVSSRFPPGSNLLSMADISFGKSGRALAWFSYLFLFYSLLVAYTAATGSIFASFVPLSPTTASLLFTALFGIAIASGTRTVDLLNRLLMGGLILCYLGMIFLGLPHVKPGLLTHRDACHLFLPLPVLITSFGFQNVIPTLSTYLNKDRSRIRRAIWAGSLLALGIYAIWTLLVLGIVPLDGEGGLRICYANGLEASHALSNFLSASIIGPLSQSFAFFAIVTSFLAQGLTLSHFLADGFRKKPTPLHTALALIPPTLLALYDPTLFYKALSFAGGICAVLLFGFLPVAMAWNGRPKSKWALILAALFSLFIFILELRKL